MTDKDDIAALKKELKELKASLTPSPYDEAAMRQWQSDMHNIREARMARASHFSPEDLRAMEAAAPTSVVKDIALRDARAPLTYCSPGPNTPTVSNVRGPIAPGGGTGWQAPAALTPPAGIHLVDRLCELDSARQRGERMIAEAKIKAAEKSE